MKNRTAAVRRTGPRVFKDLLMMIVFVLLSWCVVASQIYVFAGEAPADRKDATASKKAAVSPAARQFPALVDVGSKQCIPCKMMEPVLEQLKTEYTGVLRVEFIDVHVDPGTAMRLGVRGIPTQIFYDALGKECYRHMGYISKEGILTTFKKLGIKLAKRP